MGITFILGIRLFTSYSHWKGVSKHYAMVLVFFPFFYFDKEMVVGSWMFFSNLKRSYLVHIKLDCGLLIVEKNLVNNTTQWIKFGDVLL